MVAIAELCDEYNVPHVVNNAYGIQSSRCMGLLNTAATKGEGIPLILPLLIQNKQFLHLEYVHVMVFSVPRLTS